MKWIPITLALGLACGAIAAEAGDVKVYKWVDENGTVHYGDSVPPEYMDDERQILNEQAVRVDTLPSLETRLELARQRELGKKADEERRRQSVEDKILLDTYLSVAEIEALRFKRLGMLEQHARLTQEYLDRLQDHADGLTEELQTYNYPYDPASEKPVVPAVLMEDLLATAEAIERHDEDLVARRRAQAMWHAKFDQDVARFKELKRLN